MTNALFAINCQLKITSKNNFLSSSLNQLQPLVLNSLNNSDTFFNKHLSRQEEFIITRCQAADLYKKLTQKNCYYFPNRVDRSPHFPLDVVGSFSHSKDYVCTAMALMRHVRSVGIDIESSGRINAKTREQIRTQMDVKSTEVISDEELDTLIFSAKESFYKLLHPIVKRYFVFSDAAITNVEESSQRLTEIDGIVVKKSGEFTLALLKELSEEFGPQSKHFFKGHWVLFDGFLLTVMELKYK